METSLKKMVLVKSFLFLLIVFWGSYNSTMVNTNPSSKNFTDIGNGLFLIFSIFYMLNAFFLIRLKTLGRLTYLPLAILFITLGFISELFNPMQIKNDYFYLFIFYIVSPLFFIMQGFVLCMLMSKSVREVPR
jgi:EamA domain-containing membrane protein RarD